MNFIKLHTVKISRHIGLHLQRFKTLIKALPTIIGHHWLEPYFA